MHAPPPHAQRSDLGGPPEAWGPLADLARRARRPIDRFLRIEAASGILLLLAALGALAWANFAPGDSYGRFWATPVGIRLGPLAFERSLGWIVNDGLMAIFFFVVGLEIRREIHEGELSSWKRAALPAIAALGGMLAPAALYLAVASASATRSGWGVPMATDIAFAVGVLTLLGPRVPAALRVTLLAVAVIDDLGAILVIALFYSSGIALSGLGVAALGLIGVLLMQRIGVRSKLAYVVPGVITWAGIYAAGVHPTIAGVLLGLMTPVRAWLGADGFVSKIEHDLRQIAPTDGAPPSPHDLADTLQHVDAMRREALSPAESLIHTLHPWVAFAIMPVFALANAGVVVTGASLDGASWRVLGGVMVGLVVGKPVGILVCSIVALRLGVGVLPRGLGLRHLLVLGMVAGVGLTMSLFIAQLAFADPQLLAAAKLGVLAASAGAGVGALIAGRLLLPAEQVPGTAQSAYESERSTEK